MQRSRVFTRGFSRLPVTPNKLDGWAAKQHLGVSIDRIKANAPSTLPLVVDTSRAPGISTPRHLLNMGKQIVKLYKAGITNVWKDYWLSKQIKQRYGISSLSSLNQHVMDSAFAQSFETSVQQPTDKHISRNEFQILHRNGRDIVKLPTFAVIFAVFFEMTPLLVAVFPRITPSTCTLPFQQKRDVKSINEKIAFLKQLHPPDSEAQASAAAALPMRLSASVHQLKPHELQALGAVFFARQVLPVSLYPKAYLKKKVESHISKIRADDILLSRFGSVAAMDYDEVIMACLDRAIPTEGKSEPQLRADLFLWMTNFAQGKYDAGFFFYPLATSEQQATMVERAMAKVK